MKLPVRAGGMSHSARRRLSTREVRMRGAIALILSLTLSGCAAHRAPVAHGADPLRDWASVIAIPRPAAVRVTLDYDIGGRLHDVTGSTLTILVPPGMAHMTIRRGTVARVAVLTPKKGRWRWLGKPIFVAIIVGVVGGLAGGLVGAVMRDAKVAGISLAVFATSAVGGFLFLVNTWADHEWRVVYVRP
jgi:hypothetical protein